jgi:acyl carrier protein
LFQYTIAAMTLFERLRDAIAGTLNVPPDTITETTRAEDLPAWDSLGHVNLMMTLEQTFDLFLDVEDFPRLNSIPTILAHLREQGFS